MTTQPETIDARIEWLAKRGPICDCGSALPMELRWAEFGYHFECCRCGLRVKTLAAGADIRRLTPADKERCRVQTDVFWNRRRQRLAEIRRYNREHKNQ